MSYSIPTILIAVLIISRFKNIAHNNIFTAFLVNIFGTLLHELMHFLFGLVTNAQPVSFSIIPRRDGDTYVLGSVSFANLRWYNAAFSGLAPLSLFVIAYFLDTVFFSYFAHNILNDGLYLLLMTILIDNAIPSSTDLKQVFVRNFLGSILMIAATAGTVYGLYTGELMKLVDNFLV